MSAAKIAELNDQFRKHGVGNGRYKGQYFISPTAVFDEKNRPCLQGKDPCGSEMFLHLLLLRCSGQAGLPGRKNRGSGREIGDVGSAYCLAHEGLITRGGMRDDDLSLDGVLDAVAAHFGMSREELVSGRSANARQIAKYLASGKYALYHGRWDW